ncbi:hypothetical protein JOE44_001305 [Chryseobacterium sp. PvR013]|uniref:hypothetical protein n=1 Tax=Chryseobacterium sp. PvR013 TaxID=2806595 RepID=UPI001AE5B2CF|nr:hypothetical protein [Chryseobacterium sp. PvR013]MBP1164421.1 hypothetical protein [Chryseobacterium sp. PvR013]
METKKATIKRENSNTQLVLELSTESVEIVLTDDNPNNIKFAFNKLLKELKNGLFKFDLEDENQDLYHHICTEYITQLNSEIQTVYQELTDYQLTAEQI